MSPVAAVAHLAALALGVWAGFAIMGAIGTPDVGAGAAEAREDAAAVAEEEAVEECRATVASAGLGSRVARAAKRHCEQGPTALDHQALCFAAVRDAIPPGPNRTPAIAACEQLAETAP